jgi:hypothetical protein
VAAKVVTLSPPGPVLISADLHGHGEDFARLRDLFLASAARGEDPTWLGVGDWVHGPAEPGDRTVCDAEGAPLYAYRDESPEVLRGLFALMDRHPGRVLSLLGNHEHAHIGGPRTAKFHRDEAAHLEAQLAPAEVAALRARFAAWPVLFRLPDFGIVITHGAMAGPLRGPADLEEMAYGKPCGEPAATLLHTTMTHYGYTDGGDERLLAALRDPGGPPYGLLVHGHDREETGHCRTGARALLLCTSFGARRACKTYLWLAPGRRYDGPGDLREGRELRRLYPAR